MGNLGREFDVNEELPPSPFEVIPKGTKVELVMDKSEVKTTKTMHPDGQPMGRYIAVEYVVVSGPYENKRLFENINFENRNPEMNATGRPKGEVTEQIAQRYLQNLGKATGVVRFSDSADFHGIPFFATVGIEPARGDFDEKNKIEKFIPKEDAPPAAGTKGGIVVDGTKRPAAWARK